MIKLRLILLICMASICFSTVAQTTTHKLELAGEYKKQPQFNSDNVSLLATLRPRDDGYNLSLTISSNVPGKYNLYIFDSGLTKANSYGWADTYVIYKWLRDRFLIPELGLGRKVKIDFDGNFIDFDQGALTRNSWERDGDYKMIKDIIPDFDFIKITQSGASNKIAYTFLVTENAKNGEPLVGITQPISIELPSLSTQPTANEKITEYEIVDKPNVESESAPVLEKQVSSVVTVKEEEAPVQNPSEIWDIKIKQELLAPFRSKGFNSYASLAQDQALLDLYEKDGYGQKIEKALEDMKEALADAHHAAKRAELIIILNNFKKKELAPVLAEPVLQTTPDVQNEEEQSSKLNEDSLYASGNKANAETVEEHKETQGSPTKISRDDNCIDSVWYYYHKVEDLYIYITDNKELSASEKDALRNRFLVYSGSFNGFADGCTNSRTQTFKGEFNRMVKAINRIINAVSEENLPVAKETAPSAQSVDDNPTYDWPDDAEEAYETGQTLFLYIVIGFIALMVLGLIIYLIKKRK